MGGWISLLVALARRDRVVGWAGVAAAPDFTETLMWDAMSFAERVASPDARTMLIKDGDHRLSRPGDLALLCAVVGELIGQDGS